MGSVFRRAGYRNWYIKYKTTAGDYSPPKNTGFSTTDPAGREKARLMLVDIEDRLQTRESRVSGDEPLTLSRYGRTWAEKRKSKQILDWRNEGAQLSRHVIRRIGDIELAAIKPHDLVELFEDLRATSLAPRSIHNIYSCLRSLFRDACLEGLIEGSPCILGRLELGESRDKDLEWRDHAQFDLSEYLALLRDERIAEDRRLRYALQGLGCLRTGELAGVRWRQYDDATQPLGRLRVRFTYDRPCSEKKRGRDMPVHPSLAEMLRAWLYSGWRAAFGRSPSADDFIVPYVRKRPGRRGRHSGPFEIAMLSRSVAWKDLQKDLQSLGLRRRRAHDLRRTGISLFRNAGASRDILSWGTHGRPKNRTIDGYTTFDWETICAEILKLELVDGPSVRKIQQLVSSAVGWIYRWIYSR